jgi:hypothetical protein
LAFNFAYRNQQLKGKTPNDPSSICLYGIKFCRNANCKRTHPGLDTKPAQNLPPIPVKDNEKNSEQDLDGAALAKQMLLNDEITLPRYVKMLS